MNNKVLKTNSKMLGRILKFSFLLFTFSFSLAIRVRPHGTCCRFAGILIGCAEGKLLVFANTWQIRLIGRNILMVTRRKESRCSNCRC